MWFHLGRRNSCQKLAENLSRTYVALYGSEKVSHIPLHYTQFCQIQTFEQTYTSVRSQTSPSPVIIAIWPYLSGILISRLPSIDVRVGVVEYILIHTPAISTSSAVPSSNADDATVELKEHILARVKWYQDHPQKFVLGNGIVISASVSDHKTWASFMPVSRILSLAIAIDTTIQSYTY